MGDLQLSLGSPIRSLTIFFLLLHRGEMWQQGEEARAASATQIAVPSILAHPTHPLAFPSTAIPEWSKVLASQGS